MKKQEESLPVEKISIGKEINSSMISSINLSSKRYISIALGLVN